eukprot:365925-Chlamydomonas_euryale.AAC.3
MAPIASSRPQRSRWYSALAVAFLLAAATALPARAALDDPPPTSLTWDPQNFIVSTVRPDPMEGAENAPAAAMRGHQAWAG